MDDESPQPLRLTPEEVARLEAARATLDGAEPEPDAVVFIVQDDRLAIQQSTQTDLDAATQPHVAQRQRNILRKLGALREATGNRLGNQRAWVDFAGTIDLLIEAIDRPVEQIPDHLVDLYDAHISLASFVDVDERLKGMPDGNDEPLAPEIRRGLDDTLSSLAPWVREFPSAREWDDARRASLVRPREANEVESQINRAKGLVSDAESHSVISPEDAERLGRPFVTARRSGFQGEKASRRGIASAGSLSLAALAVIGTFYANAVASDFGSKSILARNISNFLVDGEAKVLRLVAELPRELSVAAEYLLKLNKEIIESGRLKEAMPPSPPRSDRPRDFDIEEARRLILAGKTPPETWLPFIRELDFAGSDLRELQPLAGLTGLERLDLDYTKVSDIAPLAGLTKLEWLDLGNTRVSDIAPLAGLTALETLGLADTNVSDIAPLAGMTALETLDLTSTQVSDIAPLARLTALRRLDLGGTMVTDLSPLAALPDLTELLLANADQVDTSPLAHLPKLEIKRVG
jgi:hypothetical protein